ncbi:MAG: RNA polymerase sigma factor [Gammaproteobacteria bacterium]|nr:RNA polymerase sigma factor [Gammaproteobacteria bacterium]
MQVENIPVQNQRFSQIVPEQLLNAAMQGDMQAHSELYRMFSQAIYTLAYGICRSRECAEDVLQNSFVQLISKIGGFENRAPFGMWLRQIAVNEALMYLRKHKKHKATVNVDDMSFFDQQDNAFESVSMISSHADFAAQQQDHMDLEQMLARLPDHVRTVVWLKEVEGYTHDEIAKLVDKSPSYSKSIVLRAYKFLRQKVATPDLNSSLGAH